MKSFSSRSLLFQLGLIGSISAVLPLLIVVLVAFSTSSDQEVSISDEITPTAEAIEETSTPVAVLIAAIAVGVVAILVAWWWASKAVKPMTTITGVANRIQGGSLDDRIGLQGEASEVQELADSFDAMLDRLQTASDLQHHLLEDASHELRTPLSALAVNTEVMLESEDPTPEAYRRYAERNQIMVDRMTRSIDALLGAARARHEQNRQVDNDLMAIVRRVVDEHRAIQPSLDVDVTGPDHQRLGIHGPSVERALRNLLANAAEHSPPDTPITVHVDSGDDVRLSVSDYGPGIATDDLATVFERYYTTSDEGTHQGIGLALVKQVAEAHGSIDVTSPLPGRTFGTRFTMIFRTLEPRDDVS